MKKKLLVLTMATLTSAIAFALPHGYAFEITYYSDASKTRVVGEKIFHCGGTLHVIGKTTAYSDEFNMGPCTIHPDL